MYGTIDIGSNTIRMVLYSIKNNQLYPMINKKYTAGLAGYIDDNSNMNEEGITKLLRILGELKEILSQIEIEEIFPFATASLRGRNNVNEILCKIKEQSGFDVRILTGEEEAIFDYNSILHSGIKEEGLLVDVGGGSTELTFFQNKQVVSAQSLPIGSLSLYSRFVEQVLPTEKEMKQIRKEVKKQLKTLENPQGNIESPTIYSVGGTARAALKLIRRTENNQIKTMEYSKKELRYVLSNLLDNPSYMVKNILAVAPERIHTLIPGIVIFDTIAKYYGSTQFVTSKCGVREGYMLSMLKERGILVG